MRRLILLLLLISTSIYSQKMDDCKTNPKNDFKLIKNEGLKIDTSIVKTKGVYVSKDSFLDLDQIWKNRFSFIRFFEDGKVYKSCSYKSFPTNEDFKDFTYGFYSEYKVENGNITIESYAPWCGYFFEYYTIGQERIVRIGTSKRMFNKEPKMESRPNITYEFFSIVVSR